MTENNVGENVDVRTEAFPAAVATTTPPESTIAQTPIRRFTVSAFTREPQRYFPTLVIGAAVAVLVAIMLVAKF